jgi:anti-sigma B factor antagonist
LVIDRSRTFTVTTAPDAAGPAVLAVTGELDHHTAPRLREALDGLSVEAGVVLDLTELAYCDSSGITVLVAAQQRAERAHSALALAGLDPDLAHHFRIIGLGDYFTFCSSVDEAVRSLDSGRA